MCFDGVKRLCHIRGKLRKKVWINQSDIVLIGLRDYQDAKADVILKYSADEARNLKSYGEFPESVNSSINWLLVACFILILSLVISLLTVNRSACSFTSLSLKLAWDEYHYYHPQYVTYFF